MTAEIRDLDLERLKHEEGNECKPATLLKRALQDCEEYGDVAKITIMMIRDGGDTWNAVDYRANMTRSEEIAFGLMQVLSIIERWRS